MIRLILAVLVVVSVPLSAWSSCNYFRDGSGALYLGSGNGMRLEIEVKNQGKTLEVLKQVCDATFQAIACKGFTLSQDEYIHGEHDGFGMTPTVNLGRDRARLTIGYLDPWIAQFAAENYEDDQNGVYASIAACEYHRSRIAIEAAERSHDVFVDQEREKARSDRMKNYSPNFQGLKH